MTIMGKYDNIILIEMVDQRFISIFGEEFDNFSIEFYTEGTYLNGFHIETQKFSIYPVKFGFLKLYRTYLIWITTFYIPF